jgi:hypothetical protein
MRVAFFSLLFVLGGEIFFHKGFELGFGADVVEVGVFLNMLVIIKPIFQSNFKIVQGVFFIVYQRVTKRN